MQVAGAIFFRYPLLWEKQKPAVHTAFVNMLCSLYPKGEAFTSFLNNIGEAPAIVLCTLVASTASLMNAEKSSTNIRTFRRKLHVT